MILRLSVSTWQVCTQTTSPGWGWGWNKTSGNIQGPSGVRPGILPQGVAKGCTLSEWVSEYLCFLTAQVHFGVVYLHLPKRIKNTQPRKNLHTNLLAMSFITLKKLEQPHAYPLMGISLVAQRVKNLSAMQETQVWSLGEENPLEKGMATHSSILAWRILWTVEPGWL